CEARGNHIRQALAIAAICDNECITGCETPRPCRNGPARGCAVLRGPTAIATIAATRGHIIGCTQANGGPREHHEQNKIAHHKHSPTAKYPEYRSNRMSRCLRQW